MKTYEVGEAVDENNVFLISCSRSGLNTLPWVTLRVFNTFIREVSGGEQQTYVQVSVSKEEWDAWESYQRNKAPLPEKFKVKVIDPADPPEVEKKVRRIKQVKMADLIKEEGAVLPEVTSLQSDPLIDTYVYDLTIVIQGSVTVAIKDYVGQSVKLSSGTYKARKADLGENRGMSLLIRQSIRGCEVEVWKNINSWLQYRPDNPIATVRIEGLE